MNIVDAYPREGAVFRTKPLFQWDWGQTVRLHINDLPASYKVEFSNSTRADAISTVQTADEVTIPAQFLESGNPIYAWIVVVDEARTTEYSLVIPVSARAKPTDLEPSPEEQTEIEQALSALNQAVEQTASDVETAGGYAEEAEQSATAAISAKNTAESKASESATSASNALTAAQSAAGSASQADTSARNAANSASDAQTAKNDTQATAQSVAGVMDTLETTIQADLRAAKESGEFDGVDGYSPTVAVTNIQGGHRVTITDAHGSHVFNVMDGEDGQGYVQDVRINGVSALTGNVANIPIATFINAGLVKAQTDYGIGLNPKGDGGLRIEYADDSTIKRAAGTGSLYKPIVPYTQHYAAFYGLAEAAGSSERNSTLPFGQYTDSAKSAIQTMLGISGIIAPVEAATASKPYVVGDAFMHGGSLYKVSDAIGTGDAIVPGINCMQTTIIEMLKGA